MAAVSDPVGDIGGIVEDAGDDWGIGCRIGDPIAVLDTLNLGPIRVDFQPHVAVAVGGEEQNDGEAYAALSIAVIAIVIEILGSDLLTVLRPLIAK